MADERSRVLTLVFTDLADSTALKTARGDGAVGEMISRHREHVTRLAAECSGRIIDWAGDGCFLSFETPTAGVLFSLRLQNVHADESDLPAVRIGVHLGEITEKPGPGEAPRIEGLAVDVAARISGLAKPGQVLMSSAVYNSARQRMGVEAMGMPLLWQLHGTYALKGFDTPLDIAEAGLQGLTSLEAPKAGEKAQLVKRAKRQPQQFKQSKVGGVPIWLFTVIVLILAIVIGVLLFRDTPQVTPIATDAPIQSLAVLPFDNLMGDAEKEYFVDGMTDTLTAELSKIASIKVIARTSAMRYKNSEKSLSEIASELGVEGLIEGSVQQFEQEVRITAQLIDGRTEAHLWGHNFEGTLTGVMKLQGDVAISIADEVGAVLTPEEREDYRAAPDVNPQAYDLYLRAMDIMQSRTEEDIERSVLLLNEAITIDDSFAMAYAGLADAHALLAYYSYRPHAETIKVAKEFAERAVELDNKSAEAYTALGLVYQNSGAPPGDVEAAYRRALEINPGLTRARQWNSALLGFLGRTAESLEFARRAVESDPYSPLTLGALAQTYDGIGDYARALETIDRALEIDNAHPFILWTRVYILQSAGQFAEAVETASTLHDLRSDLFSETLLASAQALNGNSQPAQDLRVRLETQDELDSLPVEIPTQLLLVLGDHEAALEQLDRHSRKTPLMERTRPIWKPLRDDPRFWEIFEPYDLPPIPPGHPLHQQEQDYLLRKKAKRLLAEQPKPVRRFAIQPMATAPLRGTGGREVVISPDGSQIIYVAADALYVRRLDSTDVSMIPNTEGGYNPSFSPDGQRVAFTTGRMLQHVPIAGGPPVDVFDGATVGAGLIWGDDDWITFTSSYPGTLNRVPASGGTAVPVTELAEGEVARAWPDALPGGKALLFAIHPGDVQDSSVHVIDVQTGQTKRLLDNATRPVYAPSGHILYGHLDGLYAVAFDMETQEAFGDPVLMIDGVVTRGGGAAELDISDDGTLVYVPSQSANSELGWVDRAGNVEPTPLPQRRYSSPSLSPDDGRVAVRIHEAGGDIWIGDLRRGTMSKLTTDPAIDLSPAWARVGEEVAFASYRSGRAQIYTKRADGTGELHHLTDNLLTSTIQPSWTEEGDVFFGQILPDTGRDVWRVTSNGEESQEPVLSGPFGETAPALSPDGRWLAYVSNESGSGEVYVRAYPELDRRWVISTTGGTRPVWAHDGTELFYITARAVMSVPVRTEPDFEPGLPELLFEGSFISGAGNDYDVSEDGQRFIMIHDPEGQENRKQIGVVLHFTEELKRLVPHPEAN